MCCWVYDAQFRFTPWCDVPRVCAETLCARRRLQSCIIKMGIHYLHTVNRFFYNFFYFTIFCHCVYWCYGVYDRIVSVIIVAPILVQTVGDQRCWQARWSAMPLRPVSARRTITAHTVRTLGTRSMHLHPTSTAHTRKLTQPIRRSARMSQYHKHFSRHLIRYTGKTDCLFCVIYQCFLIHLLARQNCYK